MMNDQQTSEQILARIVNMEIKGGSAIGRAALAAMKFKVEELGGALTAQNPDLEAFARRVLAAKPSMGTVHNAAQGVLAAVERARAGGMPQIRAAVNDFTQTFLEKSEAAVEQIGTYAGNLMRPEDVVMVLSYSETLMSTFRHARAHDAPKAVICCESRPLFEGQVLAGKLAAEGISVTLITEAAIAQQIPKATLALIGCDAILADGSIVNKTGSLTLAALAHAYQVPLYVVGETLKFFYPSLYGERINLEERPAQEIYVGKAEPPDNLRISNVFFEIVPAKWIAGVVTEQGYFPPAALRAVMESGEQQLYGFRKTS